MKFLSLCGRVAIATALMSIGVSGLVVVAPASAQPASTIPGDGTYLVGTDIQSGTYVSNSPGYCSWYRLSSLNGASNNIIDSGNTSSGKQYVTIAPSDVAFKTLSCSTWSLASAQPAAVTHRTGTIPGDGTFLVGPDVQSGTYVSNSPGYCSWYRLSSLDGASNNIIDSGNTSSGKQYVTIAPSDVAFKTLSCSTWSLAG